MARAPVYGLHKPSGQARTTFNGKRVYLGPHGSTESLEKFHEVLARWKSARVEGKNPADTNLTVSRRGSTTTSARRCDHSPACIKVVELSTSDQRS